MRKIRWGILSTGTIARNFAKTVKDMDDVQILAVASRSMESASAFIEKNEYSFPVFYDINSDAALTYGAYSLPTTFFIDADGYAVAQATGAIDAETLQKGIDMIR